jgi:CRISPR-associated protein Cas5d
MGGEKCSYHIPTYEALKGVVKSIYWKPTLTWIIDAVRVMKHIRTQTKGTKPRKYGGNNDLAIYTFLTDVEYQVRAHFEWNSHRPELAADRNENKHHQIAKRALARGGRQDIFLGTRDCQGYVEPCAFGTGSGELDHDGELAFGLMFHSFGYPDQTGPDSDGKHRFFARSWQPTMENGVIIFTRPEDCKVSRPAREMKSKLFRIGENLRAVEDEANDLFHQLEKQS